MFTNYGYFKFIVDHVQDIYNNKKIELNHKNMWLVKRANLTDSLVKIISNNQYKRRFILW